VQGCELFQDLTCPSIASAAAQVIDVQAFDSPSAAPSMGHPIERGAFLEHTPLL